MTAITPPQSPNGNKTIAVPTGPAAGEIAKREIGGSLERRAETATATLAALAEAQVKARCAMALQFPRDIELVRVKILAACSRPLFAEKAIYAKPVGFKLNKKTNEWEEAYAEGLSIRFAEEAVRALGNAMTEVSTIYDDDEKRIIRVSVTDLETNVAHYKDVPVEKTVERRKLRKGQSAIGQRTNTEGYTVFIVEATEDDMLTKGGALASKALRDKILMLVPSDIQEEARARIYAVQAQEDAKDPAAAKRALIDAFAANGVQPDQLAEFIGHDLGSLAPAELQRLRAIFSAIQDGEATWTEVIEQKRDFNKEYDAKVAAKVAAGTAAPPAKGKANVDDLAAQAKAKREAAAKGETKGKAKPEDSISRGPGPEDKGDAPSEADMKQRERDVGEEG